MKVLWLCNIMLPSIASQLERPPSNGGGWLISLSESINKINDIELTVCFPMYEEKEIIKGNTDSFSYYGFPKKIVQPTKYEKNVEIHLKNILNEVKPDIIHIWGTEYPHTLSMVNVCNSNKIIVSIQGLCSVIAKHYMANLPINIYYRNTFRDLLKRDNLACQQKKFFQRGEFEVEAIKKIDYVMGRTTWDKANIEKINKDIEYFFCNETLRNEFYKHKWDINLCERHSIFISQGSYPVKGLHMVLGELSSIIEEYPDTHLYIAGENIFKNNSIKDKIKLSSYSKHILKLINDYNLHNHITFLGNLDEKQMCLKMLQANVFVSPSSIENSPNSLGEAMLLGIPCVASCVGGVQDMLEDKKEGFIYPFDEPYMLSYYIKEIFKNDELAIKFSENGRKHANITHNKQRNLNRIIDIYNIINNKNRDIL
ncbi:MAG: glycosyltransferase family 4 protein [Clostridium sp.]